MGFSLLLIIVELVRRRKLREEYAWMWLLAGGAIVSVGMSHSLLRTLTRLIGANFTSSTLFFFGIFFILALCLQFSVRVSRLETKIKNLAQEVALQKALAEEEKNKV